MTHRRTAAYHATAWAAILLLSTSCKMPNNPMRAGAAGGSSLLVHNLVLGGRAHADGFCRPADNCSACHGAGLTGGTSGQPSCLACHADLWNRPDCGKGTASHTVPLRGVMHKPEYCRPQDNCTACHGADLKGGPGGIPSCTSCHAVLWNNPNCGSTSHTANLGGKLHAPNFCDPNLYCAGCHGADLKGGPFGASSCTSCHGARWTDPNCGQNTHSVNLGGVYHADQYCRPYQNCVSCHGPSLRGGTNGAPSCLKCHDQKKWMDCGTTQHNDVEEGVRHARNKNRPATDCAPCHGGDLRGGPNNEPSCYKCHGKEW